jgi:hypothetical protein
MGVETQRYIRKPLYVDAVRVTAQNFDDIVAWCQGEVDSEEVPPGSGTQKKFIKVRVHHPKNPRQTKAFIGDWVLYTERGYKVYTNKPFRMAFDLVEEQETSEPELVAESPGPSEIDGETTVDLEPVAAEPTPTATPSAEEVRLQTETDEERKLKHEPVHGAATGADPEFEGMTPATPPQDAHTTPQGEPHEYVEATPSAIADAVNAQPSVQEGHVDPDAVIEEIEEKPEKDKPVSDQRPEHAAAGKRVLSEAEQRRMGPDEVRALVSSGEVILAQDLAESA